MDEWREGRISGLMCRWRVRWREGSWVKAGINSGSISYR